MMKCLFKLICIALAISSCGFLKGPSDGDSSGKTDKTVPANPEPKKPSTDAVPQSNPNPKAPIVILKPDEGIASKENLFILKFEWLTNLKSEELLKSKMTFAHSDRSAPTKVTSIVFDPQMPSMHHGTSTTDQKLIPDGNNSYVFVEEGVYFIMGGAWEIRITATGDGVTDQVVVPVNVP
jgi:hypothetical protein